MRAPRLPNPLAVRRATTRVSSGDPHTNPCRSRTRYKSEESARANHRARTGGYIPAACDFCGGWHLVRNLARVEQIREAAERRKA